MFCIIAGENNVLRPLCPPLPQHRRHPNKPPPSHSECSRPCCYQNPKTPPHHSYSQKTPLAQNTSTNRIQSHITHIQHTSILPTLILTSVLHHPTPSFNPTLIHSNTPPPFCHLVPQIFQSLHSRSCPTSLEQTPSRIATKYLTHPTSSLKPLP